MRSISRNSASTRARAQTRGRCRCASDNSGNTTSRELFDPAAEGAGLRHGVVAPAPHAGLELERLDPTARHGAEVELHLPALIPDDYLPDPHARLTLYKRISAARDSDALRELQVEMIDRFGLLPDPAKHLFAIAELKLQATRLGIRKLVLGEAGGRMQFTEKPNVDPMSVIRLIQGQPKHYRMDGPDKLRITLDLPDAASRFNAVRGLLTALAPS
mgnify:CR=1 FL=1